MLKLENINLLGKIKMADMDLFNSQPLQLEIKFKKWNKIYPKDIYIYIYISFLFCFCLFVHLFCCLFLIVCFVCLVLSVFGLSGLCSMVYLLFFIINNLI